MGKLIRRKVYLTLSKFAVVQSGLHSRDVIVGWQRQLQSVRELQVAFWVLTRDSLICVAMLCASASQWQHFADQRGFSALLVENLHRCKTNKVIIDSRLNPWCAIDDEHLLIFIVVQHVQHHDIVTTSGTNHGHSNMQIICWSSVMRFLTHACGQTDKRISRHA